MGFETEVFDLSFDRNRVGGSGNLTASCYTVDGVSNSDGSPRLLSIGQLVMALCLSRAAELEAEIIGVVENLNSTSENLERMTQIEKKIVDTENGSVNLKDEKLSDGTSYYDFLTKPEKEGGMGLSNVPATANSQSEQLLTDIEAKMDSLNSFSQQTMIDLQSLTAKRDQSYDMISNILKSVYTTLATNVNNM